MKLFFDLSSLNPGKITGVGVYMLELLNHLSRDFKNVEVVPVVKLSRFRKKKHVEKLIGRPCEILFPWTPFFGGSTLYHGPDFKLHTRSRMPQVVTVHDTVTFEREYNDPSFFERSIKSLTRVLSRPTLKAVIVNSKFTESQVLKNFPTLQGRTFVTYLGCDRARGATPAVQAASTKLPESYLLFLGTLEKRKNVLGVIQTFEILKRAGRPEKLVLAGSFGFEADKILAAIEASPYRADIVRLGYADTGDIPALYRGAKALFFPSWYEGFGIPALEAMNEGCPVVASQGGALEEICGNAALFVDPKNPEQMATTLTRLLNDKNLQEDLRARGKKRAATFTWASCAQATLAVYERVLKA